MPKSSRPSKNATDTQNDTGGGDTTSAICQRDLLLKQLNQMDAENGNYGDGNDNNTDGGKHSATRGSLRERLKQTSDALHLKSAMAHVGLLVSLSIYCAVGGLVGNG